jgi:transcriptional regulator with XRE-family HTH domain
MTVTVQALFVTTPLISESDSYDAGMHPGGRPAKSPRSKLGERIAQARLQAGLSQIDLAQKLGVSQQVVANWERKAKAVRTNTLTKLAQALNVSVDQLLGVNAPKPKRLIAKGRLQSVFEAAAQLPRRQQEKVAEFVEAFVERHRSTH